MSNFGLFDPWIVGRFVSGLQSYRWIWFSLYNFHPWWMSYHKHHAIQTVFIKLNICNVLVNSSNEKLEAKLSKLRQSHAKEAVIGFFLFKWMSLCRHHKVAVMFLFLIYIIYQYTIQEPQYMGDVTLVPVWSWCWPK